MGRHPFPLLNLSCAEFNSIKKGSTSFSYCHYALRVLPDCLFDQNTHKIYIISIYHFESLTSWQQQNFFKTAAHKPYDYLKNLDYKVRKLKFPNRVINSQLADP